MSPWFAILALLTPQSVFPTDPPFPSDPCATTRPIDGLLNGDFELASPCTSLGPSHGCGQPPMRGPFADGGFWVGAEGMTRTRGSGRFLRIGPAGHGAQLSSFVYQRVGSAPELTPLATIAARARVRRFGDEARITFAEADGEAYALSWFLSANQNPRNYENLGQGSSAPLSPDHPDALWEITEENGAAVAPMCWYYSACGASVAQPPCGSSGSPASCQGAVTGCENYVGFFREHSPLVTCPPGGSSSLEASDLTVQAHVAASAPPQTTVVSAFRAPRSGCIRIAMRVWRPRIAHVGPQADAELELVHEHGAATTTLRCALIAAGDDEGIVLLDRLWVDEGDRVATKIGRVGAGLALDVFFDPTIVYEGRRLTYRIARAGTALGSASSMNPDEQFASVFVADNAQWQSLALTAGADWASSWPSPPVPPLEIELGAPPGNAAAIDFDDVRALVHYCDARASELERELESYLGWAREIGSYQRDRGKDAHEMPAPPNPDPPDENQLGTLATPYEVWNLRAKTGKSFVGANGSLGLEPASLWDRVRIDFDATDYADWCWMREQEWFHRNAATERAYSEYDCSADVLTGLLPGNACQDTVLGPWLSTYLRTGDVSLLRLAAVYAEAAAQHGVHANGDVCNDGLVELAALPACGGPPAPFDSTPRLLDVLNGTGELVRTYCAVKRWNLEHPGSGYFAGFDLDRWMRVARGSLAPFLRRLNDYFAPVHPVFPACTDPTPCSGATWSSVSWHRMPGTLDDSFGYLAQEAATSDELSALIVLEQQLSLSPTADELDVEAQLECFVDNGVANLLPTWFEATLRGEPNAADQGRGWPHFVPRATTAAACDPEVTAGRQLVLASKYWTKFQIDGVWVNCTEHQQQLADQFGFTGQGGIPPHYYVGGLLLAAKVAATPAERDDLRDVLFTILRTTRLTFRDAWGLEYGFALHPPGWPGYAPNTATLPSRFQQRTIAALIEAISIAGWEATGVQRTSAPEVEVAPPSLVPAQAPPLFVFRAKFPGTTDALALQSALTQRTEVGWWRATAAGWEYEILWPPQPGTPWASFTVIPPSPGADEIELVLTLAPGSADPFAGRTFKLDVHAWTTDGAWDRATSYQQW